MKRIILLIAVAFVFSTSLTSRGVMFGGSKYQGTIIAKDHPDADIYVDGQKLGNGTATKLFARNKPLVVTLEEEGCDSQTLTYDKSFRTGNFILSALTWGIIGIGVDLGTGASYKPDHNGNINIDKLSTNNFTFNADYSRCKKPE
jgi:hypothetical protein